MEFKTSKWVTESINSDLYFSSSLKKIYYSGESEFQTIDVVQLSCFGRSLLLDGHIQSSEEDEFMYHEALVHPALLSHPNPKTVFLAGGGEGSTARELLRHKTVEKVVMVDIDGEVVAVSKQHLPNHHQGAFEDPRLKLHVDDALKYAETTTDRFDVIVMDLCDPVEEGPAYLLYTQSFFTTLMNLLTPGGVLVTQSGPGGFNTMYEVFCPVYKTISTVFKEVAPMIVHIPSFFDYNAMIIASNGGNGWLDPRKASAEEIDSRIEARITGGSSALRFYDGETHRGIVSIPKAFRKQLSEETTVITIDNPRFCFSQQNDQSANHNRKPQSQTSTPTEPIQNGLAN